MKTTTTKRAARAALMTATTLTEYPGGTPALGETVAAAIARPTARITDHGEAGIVVEVDRARTSLRFVIK